MTKSRFLLLGGVALLFYISVHFSAPVREKVLSLPLHVKTLFLSTVDSFKAKIDTFYQQKQKIAQLEKELASSRKNALLSVAFASKLNHLLEECNLTAYRPHLRPVRALSYVTLGDFGRVWLDFPDYNRSKIYGLLFQGYAAGIVDEENGYPMARLLRNPKMVFSVAIGKKRDLGILFGGKDFLSVKYIPSYADVHLGDEVITSGHDNIFYEGVKVGEVVDIQVYNLYKMAIVKPYALLHDPEFFYAVDAHAASFSAEENLTMH